jgi:predicted lipoprotein with Yx(FWY)xxD motif
MHNLPVALGECRMIRRFCLVLALALTASLGSAALAQTAAPMPPTPTGVTIVKLKDVPMFAGDKGLTLYVFDPDADGKSACNGGCAAAWPPLAVADGAKAVGMFTIITRDDGSKQWAYKGKPLYYFKSDKAPMDVNGDGVGGKWHIAKP